MATVESLESCSEASIMLNLGKMVQGITSTFCCGGEIDLREGVQLVSKSPSGSWSSSAVMFPGTDHAAMQQLLDACSVASFGIGSKQVTDKQYRDALKLDPDMFMTTFQLCNMPILNEIAMMLVPGVHACIRAELYKLNVYTLGGHFKKHVDTPQSNLMFGSLVVCLPTQFSGGRLVTRHDGQEVSFDWSSTPNSPMRNVHWAAFFSDIEHEILPVTDGIRITLTYNLYYVKGQGVPTASLLDVTTCPFYNELRAALDHPIVMRSGGVLGFGCQHAYVFEELNVNSDVPTLLKGADRIVYEVARSLDLSVVVKPVVSLKDFNCQVVIHKFPCFEEDYFWHFEQQSEEELVETLFQQTILRRDADITWCQKPSKWHPAAAGIHYGNNESAGIVYQTAAILVTIPEWGSRRASSQKTATV